MEPMAPEWRAVGDTSTLGQRHATHPRSVALSTRHLTWIAGSLLAAMVLGATITMLVMPTTGGVVVAPRDADDTQPQQGADIDTAVVVTGVPSVAGVAPRPLIVDVEGAVARPGLVHVPPGARVGDALELAGGFAANADLAAAADQLNLAQQVTDGLKVIVPAIGDVPTSVGEGVSVDGRTTAGGPVDLNEATESQLDSLPGVGPATIAKIVAAREETPFRSVDELHSRGIMGEATFRKLRDHVSVGR